MGVGFGEGEGLAARVARGDFAVFLAGVLAFGAPVGGASAYDCAADWGAALVAGGVGAAEDAHVVLLLALFAGGVGVVAEGCAAVGDAFFEDGADGVVECGALFGAEGAGGDFGVEAGEEQGFIGVDVADAGDAALVEQGGFEGDGAPAQGVPEGCGVEGVAERFGAELGEGVGHGVYDVDGAEFADINEAELVSIVELEDGAGERLLGMVGRAEVEAAGHAEVDDAAASVVELQAEVLAAPLDGLEGASAQLGADVGGGSPAQQAFRAGREGEVGDAAPADQRFELAADSFDFGEFGHGG